MKHTLLLLAVGVAIGALIANKKSPEKTVDPIELAIEKSKQTMQKASVVSAKADQQVAKSISKMKETIEVLEEEKEQLVEQVKVMENEIIAAKSAPVQPFDVLAIGVSDTASRK